MTVYWLIILIVAEVLTDFSVMFWLLLIPFADQDRYDSKMRRIIERIVGYS